MVWSQQPPPPTPPDPVEDLYTNPPNTGPMLTGTKPNQFEADRRQFEAQLTSYYILADASADRLTGFVYALSAAVTCEQLTLAAAQAVLELPANPSGSGVGALSGQKVVLTGVDVLTCQRTSARRQPFSTDWARSCRCRSEPPSACSWPPAIT